MESEILKLFLFRNKLKFSEISKKLKERSNKVAYHLKLLIGKGVLVKKGEYYSLSESAEHLIPYLSDKTAVLPVVLIGIGDSKKCFLEKRKKKPFLGKYGLPAGRMILGESIEGAVKRIMKKKYGIAAKLEKVNSVSLENVLKERKAIHSFLLIFVSAATEDEISLINLRGNKSKMIGSDYDLIRNDFEKEVDLKEFETKS